MTAGAQATVLAAAAVLGACERALPVPPLEPAPGALTVVDAAAEAGGDTGFWPALAIDAYDVPHLAYCDVTRGDVRYGTRRDGAWQLRTILDAGAVGKYLALALDSRGVPGIVYYDQSHAILRYARRAPDGSWPSEPLTWGRETGVGAELRYDAGDVAHVFYYTPSGSFVHAVRREGSEPAGAPSWERRPLAAAYGGYSARASVVAGPGGFWLSFVGWSLAETQLFFARPRGEDFHIETLPLERGAGWRSFIAFDAGEPAVLYSVGVRKHLRMARPSGDSDGWERTRLLEDMGNFAAAQSEAGDLVIAYEDVRYGTPGLANLKLLTRTGGAWRRFDVDREGPVADHMAVAIDARGRAVVAYHSGRVRGLKIYDETVLARPPPNGRP